MLIGSKIRGFITLVVLLCNFVWLGIDSFAAVEFSFFTLVIYLVNVLVYSYCSVMWWVSGANDADSNSKVPA